jgi:hypothetical protein
MTSAGSVRGVPGVASLDRGVCAGRELTVALARRGLASGVVVKGVDALGLSAADLVLVGDGGVLRRPLLSAKPGIVCLVEAGDDPCGCGTSRNKALVGGLRVVVVVEVEAAVVVGMA